ncbi:nucleotide exchange factor GrpE [Halegenticoccus tardaugens]|uniref:nucleotide exchange factor GrpE n=1 Tax=Halegenticoccus tardaugens TaxID=2071624 RepID=UPI00100AA2EF|nr:nucleotide exchange factor GrpE [Halegenticoccus tardaugens]
MTEDAGDARGDESEQFDDSPEADAVGANGDETASDRDESVEESADETAENAEEASDASAEEAANAAVEEADEEPADEADDDVDDELAAEVRELRTRVDDLESELAAREERIDDLQNRLKRSQADFQNYKKRAKKRQQQIRDRATEDLVERVVTVRDNLVRALDQDESADIRDGLRATLDEFDRILADENVSVIEPEPGEEVDPQRHEVMMRVESDQPEDTVASVYQPGYEMADRVLRAAQITVSKDE